MTRAQTTGLLLLTIVLASGYAMVDLVHHWSRFIVLGGIALTAAGTMIAIGPIRRD